MSALSRLDTPAPGAVGRTAYADLTATLIQTRQQLAPKRLFAPGPDARQIHAYFQAAAAAPDHGQILPWRFVVVPAASRAALGEVFAQALRERDASASDKELAEARDKAHRGPFVALAIVRDATDDHPEIPLQERLISLGCAIQNLLLSAHADGFGSGLVSGQAMQTARLRRLFALGHNEQAVCFVAIGTADRRKPIRPRPDPVLFVSELNCANGHA
ncbi:nitroreductase family protein [Thiomonas arsenitoxydans]|uniref:nitroreductase family protein n=1 Tax=Thiomonas arsenitoxydans (strain DSM 22701 / CIP 110005 / 3As) TaxID=426114 RepID=UPI001AD34BA5|nr:nitroreductase family protein [Thiomonas arsenitoxydans]MBN8776542.1 nitroreductase family protein [Thiomonas arsenitoxydans]